MMDAFNTLTDYGMQFEFQSYGQQFLASFAAGSPSPFLTPGPTDFTAAAAATTAVGGGAAGPFDLSSFSLPLTRGLDALGPPLEFGALLGRPLPTSGHPAGSISDIPSHGTVTSYIGTPPSAASAGVVAGNLAGAEGAGGGFSGGGRGVHVLSIPSLGQPSTLDKDLEMYQAYLNSHQQHQHTPQSYQLPNTCDGAGGTAGVRHHGSRHKTSIASASSGPAHVFSHGRASSSHHHHHHGIPVAHNHAGHTHVGKAVAATSGGGAAGCGARGAVGGLSASGKPTRSARAKAVFAALEAEVAGKLSELEALQHENATLTQRVEILEVAVERQSAVLSIMSSAAATMGRVAAVGSVTAAAAAAAAAPPPNGGAQNVYGNTRHRIMPYCAVLQEVSLALLATENSATNPEAEMRLVQLVASAWLRSSLVCIFQPLTQLRLKGLNLETNTYSEPSEQHWMEVIKFMTVSPQQIAEMDNLFHSYNLLHGSFRAELQDTQRELGALVGAQDQQADASRKMCSGEGLTLVLQQTALLKRVRNILQKTHLLYSSTIGVAAMRILKPKELEASSTTSSSSSSSSS
ncbi:hypothetical protein VOLCADRAFT_96468 [Volvox carteri f. nagariensis]|uniref:Uncharacterized protein n=1 Tax=Volvox carteri f. nagariensis TaxID=3068 RepID=D8UA69_VOLCA|nr:uncharacterized protein VOLCADRAFT_96468 [Volvox carteri f. nagariensis]EFJ43421.1 hypothetical protein VOLCADRAFT_96468 [Volvox carteri f. nagariensis]|eukprot:XP_002955568.1 hypothetical protein VOLCADRAFT_96468 [Volvox carteri f. nagariensis]